MLFPLAIMWSPIKHSLLVRRLGKNPIPTTKALLSFPQKMKSKLAGQWAQTSKNFTCGMTCCLVLQLPTAFSLWASGTHLCFVQILGIYKERLQHEGFRLKPEKRCFLQGASEVGVHGSNPTKAPRLLGLYLIKLRLAAPFRMGAKTAHADTGWVPGLS